MMWRLREGVSGAPVVGGAIYISGASFDPRGDDLCIVVNIGEHEHGVKPAKHRIP